MFHSKNCILFLMLNLICDETTRLRISQIELQRARYFGNLAEDSQQEMPVWLQWLQRLGLGANLFYSKQSEYATRALAAEVLRAFQAATVKWASAPTTSTDYDVNLINNLFGRVPLFEGGNFGITNETLPLYSAALFDVVKAYVIESRRVPDILRVSNVGTRVERSDIVAVLQNHWSGFKPTKRLKA